MYFFCGSTWQVPTSAAAELQGETPEEAHTLFRIGPGLHKRSINIRHTSARTWMQVQ